MNLHRNARTTPFSCGEMVRRVLFEGQAHDQVAAAFATTAKTAAKWIERYQMEGLAGLEDGSSFGGLDESCLYSLQYAP